MDKIKNILIENSVILDDDQVSVVLDTSEKLLVIAGAGSGKTMTLIAKIYYLIKYKNIEPHTIVMIAFTNEAVDEIKNRLEALQIYSVNVMTFHKLGLVILKMINEEIKVINSEEYLNKAISTMWINMDFKISLIKILRYYYNINIKKISLEKLKWSDIENTREVKKFINFIANSMNKEINIKSDKNNKIMERLNMIYLQIIATYNIILNNEGVVDFNNIITDSTKVLATEKLDFNICYVFVDEYQDISKERFDLLNNFVNSVGCKLIVVGDDWQSIYYFAGSDVQLFTKFKEIFYNGDIKYLNNTYRNSQQLINITGKLISNNKNQFNKELKSNKVISNPIKIYYYFQMNKIRCLNHILNMIIKESTSTNIMILGRYKKDSEILSKNKYIRYIDNNCYQYKNLKLLFYTIHSSKGLSGDEVIILNMQCGMYGFPSAVADDKIKIDLFGKDKSNIEEERRLLYVSLTRTKNRVYIMAPYFKYSIFIDEIKKIL